jgi:ribosome-binding ATPase
VIAKSAKIIPTQLEFVDIAGLVKGASKGEGLGNKFLGTIREVDAICHVLRCFDSGDITHVEGSVDPIRDAEIVETELMLSDMESLERRIVPLEKKAKSGDKDAKADVDLMSKALDLLRDGKPARLVELSKDEVTPFKRLNLITSKPVVYICNVEEDNAATGNAHSAKVFEKAAAEKAQAVVISAAIEAEVAQLETDEERKEFLDSLGLEETGLTQVIRAGYALLDQITFFTIGPKEARAWTVFRGAKGPQAAGAIHTDFERGFIAAETIAYDDYIAVGGEQGAKETGKLRLEGRDYLVQDGDVFHFRFNV